MQGGSTMKRRFHRLAAAGLVAAAAILGTAAKAQLMERKDLSYAVAKAIAEAAIESCQAKGYRVSAVVVDRAGETLVALRGDGSGPHTMENARRKAYTAVTFRQPTTAYAKRFADNDPTVRPQGALPHVLALRRR